MYIDGDSIIVFLMLSAVCIFVYWLIAHIDTYFEYKEKFVSPEYIKEFTFTKWTLSEIKRMTTGKGLF